MKNNFLLILVALAVFLSSCHKDLDQKPLSNATTETFFENQNDFILAVNGLYAVALRGNTLGNSYGYADRLMNLSETRSDNLYAITDGARPWEGINGFQASIANNQYVAEAWVNNYDAINKANLILEQIQSKGGVFYDDSLKVSLEAQTRFLRAFCYFDLVRWFGKVPLVDHTLSIQEAKTLGRTAVPEVYNLIISDLQYAEQKLGEKLGATNTGRITKWAAKGILAQVYMARSAPTYGIEGPGLGLNEWDKAYALLNEIATLGTSNKGDPLALLPKYADIFKTENNSEVVFDVQYISGADGIGASFVWVLTPDQYFQSIGLSSQGANYQRPVATGFRNSFDTTDLRRKYGILDSFTYDKVLYDNYSFYVKYVDKTRYGSGRTNWGVNFVVLRLTDVLMLRAECTLHGGGGSQSDVDGIVASVRKRAGDSTNVSGINLDQLLEERKKEFFGEGLRWFDLQRSGKLPEIMNAFRQVEDATNNRILPVTINAVIYPVPTSQMQVAPGLYTQNPGYD